MKRFSRQKKCRPEAFFREGDARVVVSPGLIDAVFWSPPMEKDSERQNGLR